MNTFTTLFLSTFTTLVAIINPLAALPVFLKLLEGQDKAAHRRVAWKACSYATLLLFFFLIFDALLLKIFGVPLSMVGIVGGIILMRIGLALFMPTSDTASIIPNAPTGPGDTVAFVPLAMPLLFGPGAIATVLGMVSFVRHPFAEFPSLGAIAAAIFLTMFTTYFVLAYGDRVVRYIGSARHRCCHAHRRLFRGCHRHGINLPWCDGGDPNLFVDENALTRKAGL